MWFKACSPFVLKHTTSRYWLTVCMDRSHFHTWSTLTRSMWDVREVLEVECEVGGAASYDGYPISIQSDCKLQQYLNVGEDTPQHTTYSNTTTTTTTTPSKLCTTPYTVGTEGVYVSISQNWPYQEKVSCFFLFFFKIVTKHWVYHFSRLHLSGYAPVERYTNSAQ